MRREGGAGVHTFQIRGTARGYLAITENDGRGWVADAGCVLRGAACVVVCDGAILLRLGSEPSAGIPLESGRMADYLRRKQGSQLD